MQRNSLILTAIAGLASVSPAASLISADSTMKLDLVGTLQVRGTTAWGQDPDGNDYDMNRNITAPSDPVDFAIRRARLAVTVTKDQVWKANLTVAGDNADQRGTNLAREIKLLYAWASWTGKTGSLAHTLQFGQDLAFFNPDVRDNTSALLFPTQKPGATGFLSNNAVGIRYMLSHQAFQFGFDIQNNRDTLSIAKQHDVSATKAHVYSDGMFYSSRLQVSPIPGWEVEKRLESWAGEAGKGLALGVDAGLDHDNFSASKVGILTRTTTASYGADALLHIDGLSASVGYRYEIAYKHDFAKGGDTRKYFQFASVQAGYAVPVLPWLTLEPAARFNLIDRDVYGEEKPMPYATRGDADHGLSGTEFEGGLNVYFKKHASKLQIAYARWNAEEGDAAQNAIRVQQQVLF